MPHPADRVVRKSPLALIDPDPESGYMVRDTRNGLSLAWRHDLRDAAAVTAHLNALYPKAPWPAHDTLKYELAVERLGGKLP